MAIPIDCYLVTSKRLNNWGRKTAQWKYDYKKCTECKNMLLGQLSGFPYSYRVNATKTCGNGNLNMPKSGCDYAENFNAGGDQLTLQKFLIDCDPTKGVGSQMVRDQKIEQQRTEQAKASEIQMFVGLFAIIVIAGFMYFYLTKKPKPTA
jgi:hypothetical protein